MARRDDLVKVSDDQTINLQVTNALIKEVNDMQQEIEDNDSLDHRLKVKYLSAIYVTLKDYNQKRSRRNIDPEEAPAMIAAFRNMMRADIKGQSILPYISNLSFDASERIIESFQDNPGYKAARTSIH